MTRIPIDGPPWYIIHGLNGEHKVCDVYCRTLDGRYFRQPHLELRDPYQWAERVAAVGTIDPSLWLSDGADGDKTKTACS